MPFLAAALNDAMPFLATALNDAKPCLENGLVEAASSAVTVFGRNGFVAGALVSTESPSLASSLISSLVSLPSPLGLAFMPANGDADCLPSGGPTDNPFLADTSPFFDGELSDAMPSLEKGDIDAETDASDFFGKPLVANGLFVVAVLSSGSSSLSLDSSLISSIVVLATPLGLPFFAKNGFPDDCLGGVNDDMPLTFFGAVKDEMPFLAANGEADAPTPNLEVFGTKELLAGALLPALSSSSSCSFISSLVLPMFIPLGLALFAKNGFDDCLLSEPTDNPFFDAAAAASNDGMPFLAAALNDDIPFLANGEPPPFLAAANGDLLVVSVVELLGDGNLVLRGS
mmetsp:Transcript_15291/g.37579  ORF Transcript_15291/g.37579 Transcript_15291/m.37579 type:complete len:343 (-) Transcript_15291:1581-2609(-)